MSERPQPCASPADLIRIEADALLALAARLDGAQAPAFAQAVEALTRAVQAGGRPVLTGMGKSGLIARKIAATLTSLSVPAAYLHPAEALHGDLGLLRPGDVVVALSYSGETEEVVRLLPLFARLQHTLIAMTGNARSTLAHAAACTLDVSIAREACHHQLAPTASTTAMLALGDALAVTVAERLGFAPQLFADRHPGGSLGRRLLPVSELMHTGDAVPCVASAATMPAIIHEMSQKRLGMTTVQDGGLLLGIISDGDLRRLLERDGPAAFHRTAHDVLHPQPHTVSPKLLAAEALERMEARKITSLVVTADGSGSTAVQGVVHMHDLVEALAVPVARTSA